MPTPRADTPVLGRRSADRELEPDLAVVGTDDGRLGLHLDAQVVEFGDRSQEDVPLEEALAVDDGVLDRFDPERLDASQIAGSRRVRRPVRRGVAGRDRGRGPLILGRRTRPG